ncbi:hypothetical protein WMY93_031059 [Mugilogobius chulae]|uniref:Uncharacterized protein n=1 Tax=Mugilogobius chulae TaxID=88201 RepID=A0AAW0MMN4_9GOBI
MVSGITGLEKKIRRPRYFPAVSQSAYLCGLVDSCACDTSSVAARVLFQFSSPQHASTVKSPDVVLDTPPFPSLHQTRLAADSARDITQKPLRRCRSRTASSNRMKNTVVQKKMLYTTGETIKMLQNIRTVSD